MQNHNRTSETLYCVTEATHKQYTPYNIKNLYYKVGKTKPDLEYRSQTIDSLHPKVMTGWTGRSTRGYYGVKKYLFWLWQGVYKWYTFQSL